MKLPARARVPQPEGVGAQAVRPSRAPGFKLAGKAGAVGLRPLDAGRRAALKPPQLRGPGKASGS
jgi:hypothetical protein